MLTKEEFTELVGNRFFSVSFTKRDGSLRSLTGRLGVRKYIKGSGRPLPENLLLVWERVPKEELGGRYRSFYPESIILVKVGGKTYHVRQQ